MLRYRVPDHVVLRAFLRETIVLNLQTGKYHGLNPTAGRMVELLVELADPADVVERLVIELDAPREVLVDDLAGLCADLRARGLVEAVDDG